MATADGASGGLAALVEQSLSGHSSPIMASKAVAAPGVRLRGGDGAVEGPCNGKVRIVVNPFRRNVGLDKGGARTALSWSYRACCWVARLSGPPERSRLSSTPSRVVVLPDINVGRYMIWVGMNATRHSLCHEHLGNV